MKLTRLWALLLTLCLLGGCLVGCGDDEPAPTDTTTATEDDISLPPDLQTSDTAPSTEDGTTQTEQAGATSDTAASTVTSNEEGTSANASTTKEGAATENSTTKDNGANGTTKDNGATKDNGTTAKPATSAGSQKETVHQSTAAVTTTTKQPGADATTAASATQAPTTSAPTKATQASTTTKAPAQASTTATTKRPTATSSSKHIITYTTTTTATTATQDKTKGKSIKILAIGNSFSVDAMNNHLYDVLASAGYTDITLGNLYIGGCSLDTHYANLKSNAAAYEFYLNTDNYWEKRGGVTMSEGLNAANWDFITVQQASPDSGRPIMYNNLKAFMALLKDKKPRARFYWHMTWAYQQNSDHWAFAHYNKDQMTMYKAIVNAVQKQVLTQPNIYGVIPAGTAIQNLRTSSLGDTLTSDGYHLKDTYGDYTAALTWFCALTGEKVEKVKYRPDTIADNWDDIALSVKNALEKPYAVTKCK